MILNHYARFDFYLHLHDHLRRWTRCTLLSSKQNSSNMNAPAVLPPDENKTLLPLVTHAVFTPIALLVVSFRLVARWKANGFKWDDYFMIAAMVRMILALSTSYVSSDAR